jgi:hypothetical protein
MMNLKRFQNLLELYGSDFNQWPREEVTHAQELLAQDIHAQNSYKEAQWLDNLLDTQTPQALPEIAKARIAQALEQAPAPFMNDNVPSDIPARRKSYFPRIAMSAMAVVLIAFSVLTFYKVNDQNAVIGGSQMQLAFLTESEINNLDSMIDSYVLAEHEEALDQLEQDILLAELINQDLMDAALYNYNEEILGELL